MRKLAVVMTMAVFTLLFAAPAFASSALTPPAPHDVPPVQEEVVPPVEDEIVAPVQEVNVPPVRDEIVKGQVVTPPSELVFTGASITLWMVLVAALVIGGVALLVAGHRREVGAAE